MKGRSRRSMRILSVADYYRHGAARVIEERASGLARRGHEVLLLAATDPERIDSEDRAARAAGIQTALLPWRPAARGPGAFLGMGRAFAAAFERLCRADRFDAILFNQPLSAWAVLGTRAARGIPSLYTFHSPWPMEWAIIGGHPLRGDRLARPGLRLRLEFAARRWIEGQALARSSAITVLSDFMRSRLEVLHPRVARRKITLIPGGVD